MLRTKGLLRDDGEMSSPAAATRPYQVAEFDGHRLDIWLKVVVSNPQCFEHEFEIERVWLLVIKDVCTRVVASPLLLVLSGFDIWHWRGRPGDSATTRWKPLTVTLESQIQNSDTGGGYSIHDPRMSGINGSTTAAVGRFC